MLNAPREACLLSCHDLAKETFFFPFREYLSLKTISHGLSLFVLLCFLLFFPPFIFLLGIFLSLHSYDSFWTPGPVDEVAPLSQRTRPGACTWPRSLSSTTHLVWRVRLRKTSLMMANPRDLASRGSFAFRSLWKPMDSYFIGPHQSSRHCDRAVYKCDLSQFTWKLCSEKHVLISILQMAKWGSGSK